MYDVLIHSLKKPSKCNTQMDREHFLVVYGVEVNTYIPEYILTGKKEQELPQSAAA